MTATTEKTHSSTPEGDHLRYLLSAYLFENITEEGRREVESHVAVCETCREELEALRRTRDMLEGALRDESGTYSFDERRRERILAAARTTRQWWRPGVSGRGWVKLAAAVLLVATAVSVFSFLSKPIRHYPETAVDAGQMAFHESEPRARSGELLNSDGEDVDEINHYDMRNGRGALAAPQTPADEVAQEVLSSTLVRRKLKFTGRVSSTENRPKVFKELAEAYEDKASDGLQPRLSDVDVVAGALFHTVRSDRTAVAGPVGGASVESEYAANGVQNEPESRASKKARILPEARVKPLALEAASTAGEKKDATSLSRASRVAREAGLAGTATHARPAPVPLSASPAPPLPEPEAEVVLEAQQRSFRRSVTRSRSGARSPAKDTEDDAKVAPPKGADLNNLTDLWALADLQHDASSPASGERRRSRVEGFGSFGHRLPKESAARGQGRAAGALGLGWTGGGETVLRSYLVHQALDRTLDLEQFLRRPLTVPAPGVGDEGLGEAEFRRLYGTNPFVDTSRDHLSTFSMDVDTASYTLARNSLQSGTLPDPRAVRVEEFVNYFAQDYRPDPVEAFSVFCDGMPSVFGSSDVELLRVGIKARDLRPGERRGAVLTLAIDVSGSMGDSSHLDIVGRTVKVLLAELVPTDRVAIVTYATEAHLLLPHTLVRNRDRILGALETLTSRGGTSMEAGLDLAYRVASEVLSPGAVHRVMLFSDGLANIGARDPEELLRRVDVYKRRGIYLTVIGVGRRVRDDMLEKLSNAGNGRYDFIRSSPFAASMEDARRIFRDNLPGALEVLAEDAKVQVDFNPETVSHYRLLGYENRDIRDVDFRNDRIDAAEVGPGTTVTVLYEIVRRPASTGPLGQVALRFRDVVTRRVVERDYPVLAGVGVKDVASASFSLRQLAAVVEMAEILRGSYYARDGSLASVLRFLETFSAAERDLPEWKEIRSLSELAYGLTMQTLQRDVLRVQTHIKANARGSR